MRLLKYISLGAAVLLLVGIATVYGVLHASLPQLDGTAHQPQLSAAVRIERDARGVPTLTAATRADLAYATGFVHAQDRFFEMDLSRRLAAGELAELFGKVALDEDRNTRLFGFRTVALQVLAAATPAQRRVLEAYTHGVNAGLRALGARPWEYWLLGQQPQPWRAEDALLVEYAMWWDLQANGFKREILRRELNDRLQGPDCAGGWKCALSFFYPQGTSWDAPALAEASPPAAVLPDALQLDVRGGTPAPAGRPSTPDAVDAGSNSWAVAGAHSSTGAALVANDMHLGQRVPTIWYHARLRLRLPGGQFSPDLNGVTLPGTPLLVAGSNGHIAWGFTNSYGKWLDVTPLPCTVQGEQVRLAAPGAAPLRLAHEQIRVKGAASVSLTVASGPMGVLLRADAQEQRCWFGAWLAQLPAATNLNIMDLEGATSVAQALALAPQIGIPHQNVVVGDTAGHIGWTIFGRIPEDTGALRALRVAPWTTAADQPQIIDPPSGRLWTANARVASDARQQQLIGADVAMLGSEYDLGARAGQIRDDLLALSAAATPADMLRIQLDDRAVFLARWRTLVLSLLDGEGAAGSPARTEFRRLVAGWNARASVDAVGYRLVRAFHARTAQAVWNMLLAPLHVPAQDDFGPPAQFEGPLWQLVTVQPLHLLAGGYRDWPQFLRAQLDATIADVGSRCPEVARCTWGARNTVRIRHPLSRALPWLAWFLDMPTLELPGDHDMPRVQEGSFGASERFAVSPGHEEQGYLLLPGGQSGHPLSPYYRAGFLAWAQGQPLPFLPGPTQHTLTLTPK